MTELIAKNPKQLDICLKMLHAEDISFTVRVIDTKKKILYGVSADVDDKQARLIEEKYRILTS